MPNPMTNWIVKMMSYEMNRDYRWAVHFQL